MSCPNCDASLLCARCRRPVFSGEPPEYPGRLCSECWEKTATSEEKKAFDALKNARERFV